MQNHYDVVIIGAGMSGLGAAIRLAMFDKNVLLLEKHTIAGGLNSFYAQKGRLMDVGLHALTNFAAKKEKGKPLTKIMKQLRLKYEDFKLVEQKYSKIKYPNKTLQFTNNIEDFKKEIKINFPSELEAFDQFLTFLEGYNETDLGHEYQSAREKLGTFFQDDHFVDMLICPLLIYGSAWEKDMDFSQFVIMFKAIFLEGFSRPQGGVRTIIRLILNRYKELHGKVRYKTTVNSIIPDQDKVTLKINSAKFGSETITANKVISSIGAPETIGLIDSKAKDVKEQLSKKTPVGRMTFTESILFFDRDPKEDHIDETIVFYNNREKYNYREPKELFDKESAVICFPNNFTTDSNMTNEYSEGVIRLTFMANYEQWRDLKDHHPLEYEEQKANVLNSSIELIKKEYPEFKGKLTFSDVFTPTTIEKFTGHQRGCVYGSTTKYRNGKLPFPNLYICGTDQGFLGIIGAILSGISIANLYGLQEGNV